jgi:hypothetical protein
MALTEDKELQYNYFSQTLVPDYVEENGVDWNVVYDARGHFEEPHTNRSIGCGTIEVRNYLHAVKEPEIIPATFANTNIDIIGPDGNISAVLFCEKEGFNPLFKAVNLANRLDLMIISTKGVSVTAARKLIDEICGGYGVPLFVLHDFDVAGFLILATLQRDTRRYQFSNAFEVTDLGLRLEDIAGLEREPAANTNTRTSTLRAQLAENGATEAEIDILLSERVELNAMTSDALIAMIERKLKDYGLEKVVPDDVLLGKAYQKFHRSKELREEFEELESEFQESEIKVPKNLRNRVRAMLKRHPEICAGMMRSRSCLTKHSWTMCGRRSERPKRNPVTLRMMTSGTMTKRSLESVIRRTFKPSPAKQWRDHVEALVEKSAGGAS